MEISTVLVLAMAILLLLSLVVFSLEMFIPLQTQFQMNDICRPYMFKIESKGILTAEEMDELIMALEKKNLTAIKVIIDAGGSKFGDFVHVVIQGTFTRKSMISLFQREHENMVMVYEKTVSIRKIIN